MLYCSSELVNISSYISSEGCIAFIFHHFVSLKSKISTDSYQTKAKKLAVGDRHNYGQN